MNRVLVIWLGVLALALPPCITAEPTNKPTCAVLTFDAQGVSPQEARLLTDRFIAEFNRLGLYRLLSREKMGEILKAQAFSRSENCSATECAIEAGKLLQIRYIIYGSVGKVGQTHTVSVSLADVESGETEKAANYDVKGEIDDLLTKGMAVLARRLLGMEVAEKAPVSKPEPILPVPVQSSSESQKPGEQSPAAHRSDYCATNCFITPNANAAPVNGIAAIRWNLPATVREGDDVESQVTWEFTKAPQSYDYNPNAVIHVNVFGDWRPQVELARLVKGELLGKPRAMTKTFQFKAPDTQGVYKMRWMFITWYYPNSSYYGGREEPKDNCSPITWTEIEFRVVK
ncbi:MAG: DUF2380 domain-containing protein [bacterium]